MRIFCFNSSSWINFVFSIFIDIWLRKGYLIFLQSYNLRNWQKTRKFKKVTLMWLQLPGQGQSASMGPVCPPQVVLAYPVESAAQPFTPVYVNTSGQHFQADPYQDTSHTIISYWPGELWHLFSSTQLKYCCTIWNICMNIICFSYMW